MIIRTLRYLAVVGTLSLAPMLSASAAQTLKATSFLPPKHSFVQALAAWSDELREKSGGELSLEIFPAGQLGPPPRQYDLVNTGAADVGIVLHGTTPGRFPVSELAGLPLSYPSAGNKSEVTSRRLTELAPEYLATEHPGVRILWMAVTPPLTVHSKTKVESPDDMKGLRIRYAGKVFQQMIEALGASPIAVPPPKTAESLSKGIIDGATFPFEAAKAFDLGPVVKYSIEPGFASAIFTVVINEDKFQSLSPAHQKLILDTTGPDRAAAFGKLWDNSEIGGRQYLVDHGVTITTLTDAQAGEFKKVVRPIIDSSIKAVEAEGKPGQEFFDAYTK